MRDMTVVVIEGARHGDAPERPQFVRAVQRFVAAHPA
jgi:hypothetical protein